MGESQLFRAAEGKTDIDDHNSKYNDMVSEMHFRGQTNRYVGLLLLDELRICQSLGAGARTAASCKFRI